MLASSWVQRLLKAPIFQSNTVVCARLNCGAARIQIANSTAAPAPSARRLSIGAALWSELVSALHFPMKKCCLSTPAGTPTVPQRRKSPPSFRPRPARPSAPLHPHPDCADSPSNCRTTRRLEVPFPLLGTAALPADSSSASQPQQKRCRHAAKNKECRKFLVGANRHAVTMRAPVSGGALLPVYYFIYGLHRRSGAKGCLKTDSQESS